MGEAGADELEVGERERGGRERMGLGVLKKGLGGTIPNIYAQ